MNDLKKASMMERVLRDNFGEGNSVLVMSKRYSLSEESINTVLGISPDEPIPEPPALSIKARFQKWLSS